MTPVGAGTGVTFHFTGGCWGTQWSKHTLVCLVERNAIVVVPKEHSVGSHFTRSFRWLELLMWYYIWCVSDYLPGLFKNPTSLGVKSLQRTQSLCLFPTYPPTSHALKKKMLPGCCKIPGSISHCRSGEPGKAGQVTLHRASHSSPVQGVGCKWAHSKHGMHMGLRLVLRTLLEGKRLVQWKDELWQPQEMC